MTKIIRRSNWIENGEIYELPVWFTLLSSAKFYLITHRSYFEESNNFFPGNLFSYFARMPLLRMVEVSFHLILKLDFLNCLYNKYYFNKFVFVGKRQANFPVGILSSY